MSETIFRPESRALSDTIVVSYYPLAGNDHNTGPRYAAEANATQFDIMGITRDGSDTAMMSHLLRRDLSPANFDERWAEHADGLNDVARNYDRVIIRGQSTGSFPALNIVKNRLVRATHVVIEDGINTRTNRRGNQKNPLAAKADWLIAAVKESRANPQPLDASWQKPQGDPTDEPASGKTEGVRKFIAEVYHWAPLWQSSYSRTAALEIARNRPELPLYFVFLGHTATSTQTETTAFVDGLESIQAERRAQTEPTADIQSKYFPEAWHSILEYPQFGAANLNHVAAMRSFVDK